MNSRKKNLLLIQVSILFVAAALLYNTYLNKDKEPKTFVKIEEKILNKDIKSRAIDLIKNKEISKSYKEINADTTIQVEQLNELDLEDIWKLTFSDNQVSKDLLELKKQFDEDSEEIKLKFGDIETTTSSNTNNFTDIEYSGFDLTGNRYVLKAKKADFKTETPELINMQDVLAKFYLKDKTILTITSDKGLYNNITLDMIFSKNVRADYLTHNLLSDSLSYSNSSAKLIATGNVRGESIKKGEFSADNAEYDLKNKTIDFSMFEKKKVNLKLKD
jgi:hypothetical protein